MTWVIKESYDYEAVELVKRTAEMVVFKDGFRGRETRIARRSVLDWEGDEQTARAIVEKLKSAEAEYERRRSAAGDWFTARKAELLGEKP